MVSWEQIINEMELPVPQLVPMESLRLPRSRHIGSCCSAWLAMLLILCALALGGIGANAADGLGVTGSITLANCVEVSDGVVCDLRDLRVTPSGFTGLYQGDVAVFTCEPNANAFATAITCDARISTGANEGEPVRLEEGGMVLLSDCIVQPVFAYPSYDDHRLLPFIRVDCSLGGSTPQMTGLEELWTPDVAPHNPDDVTWPPIDSGYDFPTSACTDSGDGSYACVPAPSEVPYIWPERQRLSVGDRVAFTLSAGGVISLSFFHDNSEPQPAEEGAYAGDQIVFADCTGPLLSDWVYMRTVYCTVGAIDPGPRPR